MSAIYLIKPTHKNARPIEVECIFCHSIVWKQKRYIERYGTGYCSMNCRNKHETAKTYIQIMSKKVDSDEECYEIKDLGYKTKCWVWKFAKTELGYGTGTYKGKHNYSARKYFYEKHVGKVPKGYFLCHACDNPSCVNPKHLWVGTPKKNTQDMINKGRATRLTGEDHPFSRLKNKDVTEIRELYRDKNVTQVSLAKKFGVRQDHISRIINNLVWTTNMINI